MRNSAWYHKLWRSKLDKLPLHTDAASAWTGMKSVLDKSMPAGSAATAAPSVKSLVAKIISVTVYVLPAAAMIATAVHFINVPEKSGSGTAHSGRHAQQHSPKGTQIPSLEPGLQDSLLQQSDSLSGDSSAIRLNASALPAANDLRPMKITSDRDSSRIKQKEKEQASKKWVLQRASNNSSKTGFAVMQKKKGINPPAVAYNSPATTGIPNYKRSSSANTDSRFRAARQLQANPAQGAASPSRAASALQEILDQQVKAHLQAVLITPGNSTDAGLNAKALKLKEEQLKLKDKQLKKLNGKTVRTRDQQAGNAKKAKANKNNSSGKKSRAGKTKVPKEKTDIITPDYTYGINAGMNSGGNSTSLYLGGFGSYALSQRWMVGGGITLNSSRSISGEYSHASYYKPDSLPQFKIIDSRKVMVLELPLYAIYKISGKISVKGGPVIGLAFKQHAVSSTVAELADNRDTLYHSKQIDTALRNTVFPKLNIGFKAGVSFQFGQFDLEGSYQIHSPYKVKSDLGGYHKSFQTFSIGIGYRFK